MTSIRSELPYRKYDAQSLHAMKLPPEDAIHLIDVGLPAVADVRFTFEPAVRPSRCETLTGFWKVAECNAASVCAREKDGVLVLCDACSGATRNLGSNVRTLTSLIRTYMT